MYGVPQGSALVPVLFVLYTTPVSDIIANHSVNHQLFADRQLQKPASLCEVTNLTKQLNACTDDIKTWMTEISSNLTAIKQKLFSFHFRLAWNHPLFLSLTRLLLALTIYPSLSMKKHIVKIGQTAYFELKRVSSIRRFLTEEAAETLVTSYILPRLDYRSCLLLDTPNSVIQLWHPATTIQHISWKNCTVFPFQNVLTIKCFSAINGSGPAYLSELLHVYTPSRTLRSSSDTRTLKMQQYKRKIHGIRTFSCFGPHIWNSLLQDHRHC